MRAPPSPRREDVPETRRGEEHLRARRRAPSSRTYRRLRRVVRTELIVHRATRDGASSAAARAPRRRAVEHARRGRGRTAGRRGRVAVARRPAAASGSPMLKPTTGTFEDRRVGARVAPSAGVLRVGEDDVVVRRRRRRTPGGSGRRAPARRALLGEQRARRALAAGGVGVAVQPRLGCRVSGRGAPSEVRGGEGIRSGDGARMSRARRMSGVASAARLGKAWDASRAPRSGGDASRATRCGIARRSLGARAIRGARGSRVGFERDRGRCVARTVGLATHRDPRRAAPWRARCPRTWVWGAAGARRGAGAARAWADPILGRTSRADARRRARARRATAEPRRRRCQPPSCR